MELKEYLMIIKKRLWLIIACILISVTTTSVYSSMYYQPLYYASTKLIVNKTVELDQWGKEQMDMGAITTNISLINTYSEIIRTPAIMDKVVQRFPELNMSTEQLSRMIQVTGLNGTQIMTLSTVDVSYERATKVVNAVTEVFQTEIPKIMKVDNVAVLHMAQLKDTPVPINPKSNQSLVVSLIVSLMVAFGIIFLLEFMDDTLKKKEDIRRVFNAPVLSVVPRMKKEKVSSIEKRSNSKQAGEVTNAFSK